MAAIDRAALIKAAAKAISTYQGSYLYMPDTQQPIRPTTEQTRLAEAAAPVIVAAMLQPLRAQVAEWRDFMRDELELTDYERSALRLCASELERLLDQIEADVKGESERKVAQEQADALSALDVPAVVRWGRVTLQDPNGLVARIDPDPIVRWLVEVVHWPFDIGFDPQPPVDMAAIARHWNRWDNWQVSDEDALLTVMDEIEPSPARSPRGPLS